MVRVRISRRIGSRVPIFCLRPVSWKIWRQYGACAREIEDFPLSSIG
jgi:hypothetical protein